MKAWIVRASCEYSSRVLAPTEEAAIAIMQNLPETAWDSGSWSSLEAEDDGPFNVDDIDTIERIITTHQQVQMTNPPTSEQWRSASLEINRLAQLIVEAKKAGNAG